MPTSPEETNDQTEPTDRTQAIPQPPDDTADIGGHDTARMPSAAEVPADGPAIEVYLNDPRQTAPTELLTDIEVRLAD